MYSLRGFRLINNLTQTELGEYLGMQKSFISKVENNKEKLPLVKFQKLLNNDRGWDTSALTEPSGNVNIGSWNKGNAHVNMSVGAENAMKIALLEQENAQLKERLKDKDEEIAFLKSLLQK